MTLAFQTLTSQTVEVISNLDLGIGLAGTSATSQTYQPNVPWDKTVWSLTKATATLVAGQNYLSGAELSIFLNGQDVLDMHWAAFTSNVQTVSADITNILYNGSNSVYAYYQIAYGTFTGQDCKIQDLSFQLVFSGSGPGSPISNPTPPNYVPSGAKGLLTLILQVGLRQAIGSSIKSGGGAGGLAGLGIIKGLKLFPTVPQYLGGIFQQGSIPPTPPERTQNRNFSVGFNYLGGIFQQGSIPPTPAAKSQSRTFAVGF